MAASVIVDKVALIQVGTGTDDALESIGYTRNGAEPRYEAFWLDVPGDENGGDNGPPIDIQYFGEIARIRLEFTKWDPTIADKVRCRLKAATAGTPGDAGTLMFGDSKTVRLLIKTTNRPRNFPRAFVRQAVEVNKGSRFSTLILEFECHKSATGVLYNATTT